MTEDHGVPGSTPGIPTQNFYKGVLIYLNIKEENDGKTIKKN